MSEAAAVGAPRPSGFELAAAARLIALLLPLALLGGALGSQYLGGLHPCEMCYWQRWPHAAAILLAALAFTAPAASRAARDADAARRAGDRGIGRDRRLSCRGRSQDLRGLHASAPRCRKSGSTAELLQADHACAAGPLRRGAVPLPRHFAGRLERDPVARRRGADRAADAASASAHDRLASRRPRAPTAHRCCASTRPANMARRGSMPASSPCCAATARRPS